MRVVFFLGLVALALSPSAQADLIKISPAQIKALGIGVAPLTRHAGSLTPGMPATVVVPDGQIRVVAAPLAGAILEAPLAEGEAVRKGQVIARLSSPALIHLQKELAQAATAASLAEETARRDEALFKEGIVPESRARASNASLAQARAGLAAQRTALAALGVSPAGSAQAERGERFGADITLTSPLDGVVLSRQAVVGGRVDAAALLYTLGRMNPLWLDIDAPADVAARLKPGMQVELPGRAARGSVLRVASSAGPAQTVRVRASISNPDHQLRAGQNVAVRIKGAADGAEWRVPVKSLVRENGKVWLFVLRTGGGFEPLVVTVLSQSAGAASLAGPFQGDEMVAVSGVAALKAYWTGGGEGGNAQ